MLAENNQRFLLFDKRIKILIREGFESIHKQNLFIEKGFSLL